MKKIITVLLVALLTFTFIINASAVSSGKIIVDTVSGKPGDEISVAINIKENPGIVATALSLNYDKSVLSLVDVKNGDVFNSSAATFGNNYNNVPFKMIWEDSLSPDNKKTGTLAILTFKISEKTDKVSSTVSVSADKNSTFNYNLKNIEFNISQGTVNIEQSEKTFTFFQKIVNIWNIIVGFFKGIFASITK